MTVEDDGLAADGDPERVHQVVANLLENAVRHSPAGGAVEVRARRSDDRRHHRGDRRGPRHPRPTRSAGSSNASTGPTPPAPSSDGGAGLGLAIARWIVDLHGGEIHPERREPHGCRMVVTLPGARPTWSGPDLPRGDHRMSRFATIDEALKRIRRGEMVLVADDEDRENEGDLTHGRRVGHARGDQLHAPVGPRPRVHADRPVVPRPARHPADGAARPGRLRHRVLASRSTTSTRAAASAPPTAPTRSDGPRPRRAAERLRAARPRVPAPRPSGRRARAPRPHRGRGRPRPPRRPRRRSR